MTAAAYDEIADWYEHEFLPTQRVSSTGVVDPLGISQSLRDLLGPGLGTCLEIGCGTGICAEQVSDLGWTPLGLDRSQGMLRYATNRLGTALGDAELLPIRSSSVDAVLSVMAHTDMPGYPTVLEESTRILKPGGLFVHIGVHPCFCGGFADRSDPSSIVLAPGYLDGHWTTDSWTNLGIRDKVGASHWPLAELVNMFIEHGLVLKRLSEGGEPTPVVLGIRAMT